MRELAGILSIIGSHLFSLNLQKEGLHVYSVVVAVHGRLDFVRRLLYGS